MFKSLSLLSLLALSASAIAEYEIRIPAGSLTEEQVAAAAAPAPIQDIVAFGRSAALIRESGDVWATGVVINYLGYPAADKVFVNLSKDFGLTDVDAVSISETAIFFKKTDGTVLAAGSGSNGQLGLGATTTYNTPTLITGLTDVKKVVTGRYNTFFVKNNGELWYAGSNSNYISGDAGTPSTNIPKKIFITGVIDAAIGSKTSYAVVGSGSSGTVYSVGKNYSGSLGTGESTSQVRSQFYSTGKSASFIDASTNGAIILSQLNGNASTVGQNSDGQLGHGDTGYRNRFSGVISSVVEVETYDYTNYVIKSDGTLWAAGRDNAGQATGNPSSTADKLNFTQSNITDVAHIAAGDAWAMALKNDGTLWVVGNNAYNYGLGQDGSAQSWTEVTFD